MARLIIATFEDGSTERVITWSPADSHELQQLHKDNSDVVVWTVEKSNLSAEECEILYTKPIRIKYTLPKEYREDPEDVRNREEEV